MQPLAKDFYSILDIPPSTSKEEIRQAYLRLARRYHPDLSDDPRSRERFEEINQAYTILSNDEARTFYNLYREGVAEEDDFVDLPDVYMYQDQQQSWWQQNASAVGVGVAVTCVLAAYSLVLLYLPNAQRGMDTFSSNAQKPANVAVKAGNVSVPKPVVAASKPAMLPPEEKPAPEKPNSSASTPANSVTSAQPKSAPKPLALSNSAADTESATLATPGRAYELLAYYALIVGDLAQFRNALDLVQREDPSFGKTDRLRVSYQRLGSIKASPRNMLQALRRQTIRENASRLTSTQLENLKAHVENWQSLENP